jgi:hypothetical protein
MSTHGISLRGPRRLDAGRPVVELCAGVVCVAVVVAAITQLGALPLWNVALVVAVAMVAAFCFVWTRLEVTLAILLLYIGLLDGYAKLGTGSSVATLGRDLILYSVAAGALMRVVVSRRRVTLPPLTGLVAAFVVAVLVQLFNPGNISVANSLGGLRPHLEFVPLFFLGYGVVRTRERLRILLILLVGCAVANGIVGLIQLNLTPDQLARWGPGYADLIHGKGLITSRVFNVEGVDQSFTRPFGLGADTGVGGLFGLCAVGASLALVTAARDWRLRLLALAGAAGVPLAVFTSQSRGVLVASIVAVLAYLVLTVSPRRLLATIVATMLALGATVTVVSFVAGGAGQFVFARYETISPSKLVQTTKEDRGQSLAQIPKLVATYPFGGGIASVGPASTFGGGTGKFLNGETLFTFYISSLGIPGLVLILTTYYTLVVRAGARLRRVVDPELRALLAAVLAPVVGLFSTAFAGGALVAPPTAPYFWLTLGVMAYWLFGREPQAAVER